MVILELASTWPYTGDREVTEPHGYVFVSLLMCGIELSNLVSFFLL